MEVLPKLKRLTTLSLGGEFTDRQMEAVGKLDKLKSFSFVPEGVSEAGYEEVEKLSGLEKLGIGGPSIGDRFMPHLKRLNNLRGARRRRERHR